MKPKTIIIITLIFLDLYVHLFPTMPAMQETSHYDPREIVAQTSHKTLKEWLDKSALIELMLNKQIEALEHDNAQILKQIDTLTEQDTQANASHIKKLREDLNTIHIQKQELILQLKNFQDLVEEIMYELFVSQMMRKVA